VCFQCNQNYLAHFISCEHEFTPILDTHYDTIIEHMADEERTYDFCLSVSECVNSHFVQTLRLQHWTWRRQVHKEHRCQRTNPHEVMQLGRLSPADIRGLPLRFTASALWQKVNIVVNLIEYSCQSPSRRKSQEQWPIKVVT
jgi:hypothetical protein